MVMSEVEAVDAAKDVLAARSKAMPRLDLIHCYMRDDPSKLLPGLPPDVLDDVRRLARFARVNLLKYIVSARVQHMYARGFSTPDSPDDLEIWRLAWQANKLDARQIGVHRAAQAYGSAYVTVLPGDPAPVIRGYSPREMTVLPDQDDPDAEWPWLAMHHGRNGVHRLIDDEAVYWLRVDPTGGEVTFLESQPHGVRWQGRPVCPVVTFYDTEDLDDRGRGCVEPFFPLQDQINITTFGLLVAQHYGAFRQRYVIGWVAESEAQALKASASRFMQFEDRPEDVKVGEFAQTDLRGYIESREASIRHLATVSQTPVHELMGQFVNLSAEALEAARASHSAVVEECRIVAGESWEQTLNLAAEMMGLDVDPQAEIVWRDTRVRSLQEAISAWATAVEKFGVPPEEVLTELPIPRWKAERWRVAMEEQDAMAGLGGMTGEPAGVPANAAA